MFLRSAHARLAAVAVRFLTWLQSHLNLVSHEYDNTDSEDLHCIIGYDSLPHRACPVGQAITARWCCLRQGCGSILSAQSLNVGELQQETLALIVRDLHAKQCADSRESESPVSAGRRTPSNRPVVTDSGLAHVPQGQREVQPHIIAHEQQRLLMFDGNPVRFTPLEYRLMQPLVAHFGVPVPLDTLVRTAFDSLTTPATRRALDKHIDRIRSKLRSVGLNAAYVNNYGYVLLPENG